MNTTATIARFTDLYSKNFKSQQKRLSDKYPTLSADDCQDIVQQAWTELYSRIINRPDDVPENMLGYAWKTALNMALARYNDECQYDRETFNSKESYTETGSGEPTELEALLGSESDSETLCLERLELLDLALPSLRREHRELIEGFYFRHESLRDLSKQLDFKSEDVAKVVKGRAIRHLRDKMYQLSHSTSLRIAA